MKKALTYILGAAFTLYILSLSVMVPYYNWQYAKEYGFMKWLFLGEIVATGKAAAWPYFVILSPASKPDFSNWSAEERANGRHFFASIHADLESIRLSGERESFELSYRARNEILSLKKEALAEAKLVRDDVLGLAHPELTLKFRNLYEGGLELRIAYLEEPEKNYQAETNGLKLHDKWADWFNANREEINFPR